jgi:hypothetical protein
MNASRGLYNNASDEDVCGVAAEVGQWRWAWIILMLGFWISWQSRITQGYTLLVFAGIWALVYGVTDIVKAFEIKRRGRLPVADMIVS